MPSACGIGQPGVNLSQGSGTICRRLLCFSRPRNFLVLRRGTPVPQPLDAFRANDLELMAGWSELPSRESAKRGYQVVAHQVQPGIAAATDRAKYHDPIGITHRQSTAIDDPSFQRFWTRLCQRGRGCADREL